VSARGQISEEAGRALSTLRDYSFPIAASMLMTPSQHVYRRIGFREPRGTQPISRQPPHESKREAS